MHANPLAAPGAGLLRNGCALALALWAFSAAAQEPNDITLRLSATTGNPGDTVEVSVELVAGDVLPETFALFLAYDPAALVPLPQAYEIVARNEFTGEPILDRQGNTVAALSLVRLDSAVSAAGKNATFEIYPNPGAIGVLVHGLNQNPIPAGPLFTVAFRILESVEDGSMTDILGVDPESEVHVPDGQGGVVRLESSFSRTVPDSETEVELLSFGFENTAVLVGCAPPAAPTGVTATTNRSDAVVVSWNAVAGANIEYRVFRFTSDSAVSAQPLGEAWQTGTTFNDITARVPEIVPADCAMPDTVNEVRYFYWVKARSQEGCESPFSASPAQGHRIQSAKQVAAGVLPLALFVAVAVAAVRRRSVARETR